MEQVVNMQQRFVVLKLEQQVKQQRQTAVEMRRKTSRSKKCKKRLLAQNFRIKIGSIDFNDIIGRSQKR